jgi:hypothetical protein
MQLQHGAVLGESAKGQNNERQTRAERDASHLAECGCVLHFIAKEGHEVFMNNRERSATVSVFNSLVIVRKKGVISKILLVRHHKETRQGKRDQSSGGVGATASFLITT